ncbi:ATP-binding protein [Nonomuraea guangzhouensis]|uniref:ATP-binding protein n=1 Tax=Nonomuraea guangzhouensis TaxID=1291555 RepID=A0ABW4GNC1_9ACTN|nr:ATP-binding protein [Nonomuraea guangzhouensis]
MAPPDFHSVEGGEEPGNGAFVVRFPGAPAQVARVRGLVTAALGREHPLYDDCVLLASELATNAILHSRSGEGGWFTVSVHAAGPLVRVLVKDGGSSGSPCACRTGTQATSGRGLPLLDALSHRWGVIRESGATAVWFEMRLVTIPAQRSAEAV